jgi:CRISPR-associated protein Csc3
MADADDLLTLLNDSDPVIAGYFEHVVNGGLGRYREIRQTGAKEGQTLYTHVLDGVLVLEKLRHVLELSDLEACLLFAAYTVHDINKVAAAFDNDHRPYNQIATAERFGRALETVGIAGLLPDWRAYLEDITYLARAHHGHLAVTADGLNRRRAVQYRLPLDRLEQLGNLMKAADCLDLSTELAETRQKEKFLAWVNAVSSGSRWSFTWHRLAENRGILTNVMHNALVSLFRERFGAIPLLYYPDGVAYLVPADTSLTWDDTDYPVAAHRVANALARLQLGEIDAFIKPTKDGIKVAPDAFESGADLSLILAKIVSRVEAKTYSAKKLAEYEANILDKDLRANQAKVPADAMPVFDQMLAAPASIVDRREDVLQRGELALAYKLLLGEYADDRRLRAAPWQHVYDLFGVPADVQAVANVVHTGRRGWFLARWLSLPLDTYVERIATDAPIHIAGLSREAGDDSLETYLRAYLDLPFAPGRGRRLIQALDVYVQNRHRQCCHCSSLSPAAEWMSASVPTNIGVQSFSNRLPGGVPREPKRNVCTLCRLQYTADKLAWTNHRDKQGKEQRTFYLHLFPHSFFSEPFLVAWERAVSRVAREGHTAFLVNADRYFRDWQAEEPTPIRIHRTRVNGVALPRLPETIGNTPVLALHSPGDNYGDQFLRVVETAVILQRFFDCRILVSRLPIPPLPPTAFQSLFFEGIPAILRGLLPADNLDAHDADVLFQRLRALHLARAELVAGDAKPPPIVLDLACAIGDDRLRIYQVAERLIERRQRNAKGSTPWLSIRVAQALGPILRDLIAGRS